MSEKIHKKSFSEIQGLFESLGKEDLIDSKELATLFHQHRMPITMKVIHKWCRSGKLHAFKLFGRSKEGWIISRQDAMKKLVQEIELRDSGKRRGRPLGSKTARQRDSETARVQKKIECSVSQ